MPDLFAQVVMQSASGLSHDAIVNTLAFETDGVEPLVDEAQEIADALVEFYDVAPGALSAVRTFLSGRIASTGHLVKVYDLSQPQPRVPILEHPWTIGARSGASNFPAEVALCLSFRAAIAPGVNAARRRGRIYIGPVAGNAATDGPSQTKPPATGFINSLLASGLRLAARLAAEGIYWSVFSRTDGVLRQIVQLWVDNAFDTMRSRGSRPTQRFVENLPPPV